VHLRGHVAIDAVQNEPGITEYRRRPKVDIALERKAQKQLKKGVGILKVAKMLGLGTGTVQRIKQEMKTV
jgi:hypothetical protein